MRLRTATATDDGLFGPDSVTWRVHLDPAMFVGGLRALVLQALHPLAMASVVQHSTYRESPLPRLFRTIAYVNAVTFGDEATARRAGDAVRAVHRRIQGVDPVTGGSYEADDPALLAWVHVALVDSFLSTHLACSGALSPAEQDTYVAESVRAAELVGTPRELLPRTVAELEAFLDAVFSDLVASPHAHEVLRFVLSPPTTWWQVPGKPAWRMLAEAAVATLPERARGLYGLGPPSVLQRGNARVVRAGTRALNRVRRLVPLRRRLGWARDYVHRHPFAEPPA